jgi:predicted RNase H-like nuclease (RuvC/YqgF family)
VLYRLSKIIGIDILAGTSSQKLTSTTSNRFAVVVMDEGKITETHDSMSLKNLIKLCRRHEPNFLGVDNIFELESNSAKVIKFCSQLPLETKVIQVTGAPPDGFESLNRLARRHNIPYPSHHANPLQSAEIICKLVEKNIGYILMPFEDETEIKISRSKSIGPGGWSQQRYSRKMRGEILNLTRDIEKQLQDHDFDFDLEVRKTEYGYDNAIFRVYTSLANVRKVVKPFKGELSRVSVSPIRKKRLEFIPAVGGRRKITAGTLRKSDRGLIVGIDPGPNTGIAVLNFAGKLLLIDSLRSAARGDIIRKITLIGDPTIVAADVRPPPDFVVKIAKMLNTSIYYPEKLYSSDDKNQLVNDYTSTSDTRIKGAHKRDALFAAIKAYNKYQPIFERINKALKESTEIPLRNKVKQLVVKEEMNIQEAIEEIKKQQIKVEPLEIKLEKEVELTEKEQELQDKIDALKEMGERQTKHIDNLEDMNEILIERNQKIQNDIRDLKKRIEKITRKQTQDLKRERAIKTRDDELKFLRSNVKDLESELSKVKGIITDLKRMIVMGSSQIVVPMKVVFEFSREGIEKTIERMNIEPFDVVLLVDPSGGGQRTAEMLIDREVKAIVCSKNNISNQAMEAFIQANVPVLFQIPIRQIDDIAVTYYNEFQQAINDWEAQREKILGEKTEEKLGTVIAEYQSKRKQELEQIYQNERKSRRSSDTLIKPRKTIRSKEIDED